VLDAAGHRVRRQAGQAAGLTAREVEVLVLVARGLTKKQIAQRLNVSAKTVNAHVEHLYTKLGVSSRGGAALFAMRHGLMGVGDIAGGAPRI
jgi:DNA-binding NarL/FixJ family response regulator